MHLLILKETSFNVRTVAAFAELEYHSIYAFLLLAHVIRAHAPVILTHAIRKRHRAYCDQSVGMGTEGTLPQFQVC